MLRLPSPFLSASVKVCFSHLAAPAVKEKAKTPPGREVHRHCGFKERILVSGALPLGQAVLVADAGHQVLQACDPGPRLLPGARHQVQGLHVFSVVEREAAVGVEAALGVALEDLRLLPLAHLPDGVDGNWWSKQTNLTENRDANNTSLLLLSLLTP